jgi:hypothetical protein
MTPTLRSPDAIAAREAWIGCVDHQAVPRALRPSRAREWPDGSDASGADVCRRQAIPCTRAHAQARHTPTHTPYKYMNTMRPVPPARPELAPGPARPGADDLRLAPASGREGRPAPAPRRSRRRPPHPHAALCPQGCPNAGPHAEAFGGPHARRILLLRIRPRPGPAAGLNPDRAGALDQGQPGAASEPGAAPEPGSEPGPESRHRAGRSRSRARAALRQRSLVMWSNPRRRPRRARTELCRCVPPALLRCAVEALMAVNGAKRPDGDRQRQGRSRGAVHAPAAILRCDVTPVAAVSADSAPTAIERGRAGAELRQRPRRTRRRGLERQPTTRNGLLGGAGAAAGFSEQERMLLLPPLLLLPPAVAMPTAAAAVAAAAVAAASASSGAAAPVAAAPAPATPLPPHQVAAPALDPIVVYIPRVLVKADTARSWTPPAAGGSGRRPGHRTAADLSSLRNLRALKSLKSLKALSWRLERSRLERRESLSSCAGVGVGGGTSSAHAWVGAFVRLGRPQAQQARPFNGAMHQAFTSAHASGGRHGEGSDAHAWTRCALFTSTEVRTFQLLYSQSARPKRILCIH